MVWFIGAVEVWVAQNYLGKVELIVIANTLDLNLVELLYSGWSLFNWWLGGGEGGPQTVSGLSESSRSHAILTYFIKHGGKLFSKMSFIDLAGSERGADVIDTGKKTK